MAHENTSRRVLPSTPPPGHGSGARQIPFGCRTRFAMRSAAEDTGIDDRLSALALSLAWYALLVPPQKEFVAQRILRRYGLRTFVPVRREWRRRNKFVKEKELREYPIAPRYVFTGFDQAPLWFDIFGLPVISGVVGLEGEPLEIPADQMARLIRRTGGGLNAPQVQKFMRTHYEFQVGQLVEIIDGPFEGRKVPVIEIVGYRAKVMLEMFGDSLPIDMPMDLMQAA